MMNLMMNPMFMADNPISYEKQLELLQAEQDRDMRIYEELMAYRDKQDWKAFVSHSLKHTELLRSAFRFFNEVPDELKYQWIIDAYTYKGDHLAEVRDAVRIARKYGKPDLPLEWLQQKTITVYRAGEELTKGEAKLRLSWTVDKRVAFWFYLMYNKDRATHVWQAEISPLDIIAYVNSGEQEVLQSGAVRKIWDITAEANTDAGWALASEFQEQAKAHNDEFHKLLAEKIGQYWEVVNGVLVPKKRA